MASVPLPNTNDDALTQVLGYLNFSSGAPDNRVLENLNVLYQIAEPTAQTESGDSWRLVFQHLQDKLAIVEGRQDAFQDATQVRAVLKITFEQAIPRYFEFHRNLLFHQEPNDVVRPFFLGRLFEAILSQGPPWNEESRIVDGGIRQFNDYVGYRPVAVLEGRKIEPYAHEWVRPIPLYVRGAGVSVGKHAIVVSKAIALLRETDRDLLRQAHFAPELMDELAIDPRAYDFDHPVNQRPNHHFGLWDPHTIDRQGRYRRFIVQQVTLNALMSRVHDPSPLPIEERLFEAAAVLAGTMLMASGISGSGPDTHDSNASLASLLPDIASTRDSFYEWLFSRVDGRHALRLRREAESLRQPFGAARQHLNARLARQRASQSEHVFLARIFSRMSYPETAAKQVDVVPVASARMLCQIDCCFTAAQHELASGDVRKAAESLPQIVNLIRSAIECGAIVDPWNILGFDANFSLFPALENTVRDHRVHDLLEIMDQLFGLYARVWSDSAVVDDNSLCEQVSTEFDQTAEWWRQFASHEVSNVKHVDGIEARDAAAHVARALKLWHEGGAAAGDVRFWSPHVEMFGSPKAYALVIDALLERDDFVASMALLVHWLGQADELPLHQGDNSFYHLAECWLRRLRAKCLGATVEADADTSAPGEESRPMPLAEAWRLARKFLDYLEANAGDHGIVPEFEINGRGAPDRGGANDDFGSETEGEDESEEDDLFDAAYENVVFRGTTEDGVEGNLQGADDDETTSTFDIEAKRLMSRLAFLECNARLWRWAALCARPFGGSCPDQALLADRNESLRRWITTAGKMRAQLQRLLENIQSFPLQPPTGDHESMLEFDRRGAIKDSLLECAISTSVEFADAARFLHAALDGPAVETDGISADETEARSAVVFGAMLRGRHEDVQREWPALLESFKNQPLLYIPVLRGGDAVKVVRARARQSTIQDLLHWLPRLGLVAESCQLIEAARGMEVNNPVGEGAITEFDELFKIGYKALIEYFVSVATSWADDSANDNDDESGLALVACVEELTQGLMESWIAHSRTLRLSVLERVQDEQGWRQTVEFIERYGADLFTQRFFNIGNLRAILHHGVDLWLRQLLDEPDANDDIRLIEELGAGLPLEDAADTLSMVLEAIVENYGEYLDYNSTTTQSDRGELLHTLLDFLRLRSAYDRVAWNLKPLITAHEILVRRRQHEAARIWRRGLTIETEQEANDFLVKLKSLQEKYAMRLPTVADRIAERFTRPMSIDRVRSLVEPAMREADRDGLRPAFTMLEQETEELASEPSGVGLDTPVWLTALDDEVERVRAIDAGGDITGDLDLVIPTRTLTYDELRRQIEAWLQSR